MIHHVFANRSNIGDWLGARGIQRLLAPMAVTPHLCDGPFVDETLAALSRIGRDDLVVVGGGGLLMDYFEPFWRGLLALPNRPRYALWGLGCCDLKDEPSLPPRDLVDAVVAGAVAVHLRDALSCAFAGSRRPLPPPVACPSVVEIDPAPPGWGVLHVDNYTTVSAPAFDAMDAACRAHASRSGRPYRRTNNRIDGGGADGSARALADCLARYAASDVVVSSALHGCIVALAMGRRLLAVSGDRKIESLLDAAGMADALVDRDALDTLLQRLDDAPAPRDATGWIAGERERNRRIAAAIAALAAIPAAAAGAVAGGAEASR